MERRSRPPSNSPRLKGSWLTLTRAPNPNGYPLIREFVQSPPVCRLDAGDSAARRP